MDNNQITEEQLNAMPDNVKQFLASLSEKVAENKEAAKLLDDSEEFDDEDIEIDSNDEIESLSTNNNDYTIVEDDSSFSEEELDDMF